MRHIGRRHVGADGRDFLLSAHAREHRRNSVVENGDGEGMGKEREVRRGEGDKEAEKNAQKKKSLSPKRERGREGDKERKISPPQAHMHTLMRK